jgi:hypothetical protein
LVVRGALRRYAAPNSIIFTAASCADVALEPQGRTVAALAALAHHLQPWPPLTPFPSVML